jgi:hypothetical protein
MFLELSQPDLKAIGRSRGFEPEIVASQDLMRHVFLTEQGVALAMASLTPVEVAGLHLLHCLRQEVDLEFFKRVYPELVSADRYASYNERFKNLFQQVKRQLIQRGLLLFRTLPEFSMWHATILERRRFRLPEGFGALLPPLFQPRQLDPAMTGRHRSEVLRDKLAELSRLGAATPNPPGKGELGRWRLENGQLLLGPGSKQFRVEQLMDWQRAQLAAAVGDSKKEGAEALPTVALLLYALSRLVGDEWLAPEGLLPLWKAGRAQSKGPEPQVVCEAAYEWGCVEKLELNGSPLYRFPRCPDREASTPPESFLETEDPRHVGLRLDRIPLAALERLCEISSLELTGLGLRAAPDLLRLSHARADTLADPMVTWLRERHPAFRGTLEKIEQRQGKLIVHENLLVARISDLALRVMLEKRFGQPGQLVALSSQFVALPKGLLPELQACVKKSGHVIKLVESQEPKWADKGGRGDE